MNSKPKQSLLHLFDAGTQIQNTLCRSKIYKVLKKPENTRGNFCVF